MIFPELWYCCLNPRERNQILLCLPFFVVSGSFIEKTTFDAFTVVTGLATINKLIVLWKLTYHMYDDVIVIPDEPPLLIVRFEPLFWLQLSAWLAANGTSCAGLCAFVESYP